MYRCVAAMAESVQHLPRDVGVVQSIMVEHGMARVA